MSLDFDTLVRLRQHHPAWRLLRADNAPLLISFLERVFVVPNRRVIAEGDLIEALEDELFTLRERLGDRAFPKKATDYLNDWAAAEHGWIRRFYAGDSDEPSFDLTPATEKTIAWLNTLVGRQFVGTESRLLTVFELLRQISEGTDTDPVSRRAELLRRRAELDEQIARIDQGHLLMLDDTAIRDRFQQFTTLARELLADFREVEDNFRQLDRDSRERIARWEGSKGELLAEILEQRDVITGTDQGRSFQAFFDFLMSPSRQNELSERLSAVLTLPAVQPLQPDMRLRKVHHDWHIAAEHAQGTVRALSRQLRQFLDDQTWLENKTIMNTIKRIEQQALDVREQPPSGDCFGIDGLAPNISLPMERVLHTPALKTAVNSELSIGHGESLEAGLYEQILVDRDALIRHARSMLLRQDQVSLPELVAARPLREGLAELIAWLQIADTEFVSTSDDAITDHICWQVQPDNEEPFWRQVALPRIVLLRD